jgi:hypothetical protein
MKNLEQIDKDIKTISDTAAWANGKAEISKIRKELDRLRLIRIYVKSNPSETSVYSQFRLLEKKIEACEEEIAGFREKWDDPQKLIAKCKIKWEYQENKTMLENIKYVLN